METIDCVDKDTDKSMIHAVNQQHASTDVTLRESVTSISYRAFFECTALH
jgi:hypothetical protein